MTDGFARAQRLSLTIRGKLLIYAAVILVLPTVMYGMLVFSAARDAMEPSLREELADETETAGEAIQQLLLDHVQNARSWARLAIMREMVVRDMDKSISQFLQTVHQNYGVYLDVMAFDDGGTCRASSEPSHIGKSFMKISGTSLSVAPSSQVTPVDVAYSTGHRAIYVKIAVPIPNPDHHGSYLGTLVAMLDRSVLQALVHARPGHHDHQLWLVTEAGSVIAGPNGSADGSTLPRWSIAGENPREDDGGGDPDVYKAHDAEGDELVVSEVKLASDPALGDLGWRLMGTVPLRIALAPVAEMRTEMLLSGSVVAVVGLLLAWLISSNISRPIKELTAITARIADTGVLEEVPPPRSHDEVGELALSFQKMVENISTAHDELVQSSKLAFLGELAAGLAHEIRTPLGIIRNSAQLLERRMDEIEEPEGVEFANFIRDETDRLNRVVTDMLDLARPAALERSTVDINVAVARAVQFLAAEAESKGVEMRTLPAYDLPEVSCDQSQIHQVFLNLLLNAVQACASGGLVEIETARSGQRVSVSVRDDGPGISDELAGKLFAPFSSKREGGIGLGLAIVNRIVKAHGGETHAANRKGGGAEFRIWLPLGEPGVGEA